MGPSLRTGLQASLFLRLGAIYCWLFGWCAGKASWEQQQRSEISGPLLWVRMIWLQVYTMSVYSARRCQRASRRLQGAFTYMNISQIFHLYYVEYLKFYFVQAYSFRVKDWWWSHFWGSMPFGLVTSWDICGRRTSRSRYWNQFEVVFGWCWFPYPAWLCPN